MIFSIVTRFHINKPLFLRNIMVVIAWNSSPPLSAGSKQKSSSLMTIGSQSSRLSYNKATPGVTVNTDEPIASKAPTPSLAH